MRGVTLWLLPDGDIFEPKIPRDILLANFEGLLPESCHHTSPTGLIIPLNETYCRDMSACTIVCTIAVVIINKWQLHFPRWWAWRHALLVNLRPVCFRGHSQFSPLSQAYKPYAGGRGQELAYAFINGTRSWHHYY